MRKPINITIDPNIDTDPAKTYLIRVEGDRDQIFALLDHAEECGCESYEIVEHPEGVDIASHACRDFLDNIAKNSCGCYGDPPCMGCAKTYLPIDDVPTSFCDNCGKQDYSDKMHHHGNSPTDTASANKGESVTLCSECARNFDEQGLSEDEKSLADVPVDPDANRLHLFKVFTINEDTSETDGIFVMALTEEGAACLYHKARAREHGNILCEVVVNKVADAEVCDD